MNSDMYRAAMSNASMLLMPLVSEDVLRKKLRAQREDDNSRRKPKAPTGTNTDGAVLVAAGEKTAGQGSSNDPLGGGKGSRTVELESCARSGRQG
jgi:hypothetical protein